MSNTSKWYKDMYAHAEAVRTDAGARIERLGQAKNPKLLHLQARAVVDLYRAADALCQALAMAENSCVELL